jgi:hypothetical protein
MICAAKKGFLTMGDCGASAVSACDTCGQPMCSVHLSAQSGFTTCLSCAAANPAVEEGEYDGVWSTRYRSTYYGSSGYHPVGRYGAGFYDRNDADGFKTRGQHDVEDENDRGSFGES